MFKPGDVVLADFGMQERGCEERGKRPAVVVSSELHNQVNRSVVVVPLTTQTSKLHWHEHTLVTQFDGVIGVAMCEHVTELDKSFISELVGRLQRSSLLQVFSILKNVTLADV